MAPLFTGYRFGFGRLSGGGDAGGPTGTGSGIVNATGGNVINTYTIAGIEYKFHQFNSSGSLVIPAVSGPGRVNYLVVGGGAGSAVGGGGAGGYRTNMPGETPGGPSATVEPSIRATATT